MTNKFITVIDSKTDKPVTINLRHVNVIRESESIRDGRPLTHIGINNYGASGFNVTESYVEVLRKIEGKDS